MSDSNWAGLTVRLDGVGIISVFKKNQYTGLYSQSFNYIVQFLGKGAYSAL